MAAHSEDRAPQRCDPSAEVGDRADEQGCYGDPAIPFTFSARSWLEVPMRFSAFAEIVPNAKQPP